MNHLVRPGAVLLATATALIAGPTMAIAQGGGSVHPVTPPSVTAGLRTTSIVIDGRLDEEAWSAVPAATDFRQSQPNEGAAATQRTEVRFLYDDQALYVGARMFDSLGAEGVRTRLVRRDASADSDIITLVFDTFHDHLGRVRFEVNPSGVKSDAYGPGNSFMDSSWDGVWEAGTSIDSLGWSAEIRIPWSQMRFSRDSVQTWGLQIVRFASRLNERTHWAFSLQTESGGPSRYGHLENLRIPARPTGLEVMPYVVARSRHVQPTETGNPFQSSNVQDYRVGGDVKYLVTSNLTLDATINPDFGQVEVDPAVVNLSAFETFFPERRPFFVEGAGLFSFGGLSCYFCSNASSLSLFYSRRIGRQPQGGGLARNAGRYADVPENTTILGAGKLTGRTGGGWSIGALNAVTRREMALVEPESGQRFEREVEPLTNYAVGRLKKDLRGGNLVVGLMGTSVLRDIGDSTLATRLSSHAESVGADMSLFWGQRRYSLTMMLAATQVGGDTAAIRRTQQSSARYFQRPDRDGGSNSLFSNSFDATATELRGYGFYSRLNKGVGEWQWELSSNVRSPGFENNDIAFLTRTDFVFLNGNVLRAYTRPTRYYRRLDLIAGAQQQTNFDGDLTDRQFHGFAGGQLLNYWYWSIGYLQRPTLEDDRLTRGGPVVKRPGTKNLFANLSTDSRRSVVLGFYPSWGRNDEGATGYGAQFDVTYRPRSNVSLNMGPSYSLSRSTSQYVTSLSDATATDFFGQRYVFSDLVQHSVSLNTRVNVTFTPTLSLELFAQPFVASGEYTNFKEFAGPRQLTKSVYGRDVGTICGENLSTSRVVPCAGTPDGSAPSYRIDPDGSGAAPAFTISDPDFTIRSLRGNAVMRWEYRPGSTLYFVWTQSRFDASADGNVQLGRDRGALFAAHPDNIFLVKMSYWFSR